MSQNIKIAVLGGGGRTGEYLINQLIERGYHIKVLLRNPNAFKIESPLIEIIQGDAIELNAVTSLINGCVAIISTIGQRPGEPLVAEQATKNVLDAMDCYDVRRYVLLAGINLDTPFDHKGPESIVATNWMKANYPLIQEDRQNSYIRLVESNVNWTLVRVPLIEFNNAKSEVVANLEDCLGNKVDAGSIAAFLIDQLFVNTFYAKAPFVCNF
jgi:putative NADH-flavin reductase